MTLPGSSRGGPDRIYREFLARRRAGEALEFEEFCEQWPQLAEQLQLRHEQYELFRQHGQDLEALALEAPRSDPRGDRSFFHRWGAESRQTEPVRKSPPRLEAGARIGEFRLLERLGQGGMGEVWQAEQLCVGARVVALKFVLPERLNERLLGYFRREVRASGRLKHPNLVTIHDYHEAEGLAWIAMECVEGSFTLRDFLKSAPAGDEDLPELQREAALLVERVAQGMQAAHGVGVIHRDLKPANILIDPGGNPKVADFGLARIADEVSISAVHDFAGTANYASPEQFHPRHFELDHRTDIYSLGVILFELLTARRPLDGESYAELAAQVLRVDAPDPRLVRPAISPDLSLIVGKALQRNPALRYPTMSAFATDLRSFLAGEVLETRFLPALPSLEGAETAVLPRPSRLQSWGIDLPCLLHRRRSRLRIACPVFLRIGAGDRYFLIRVPGEGVENDFLPIGGVLKYSDGEELSGV